MKALFRGDLNVVTMVDFSKASAGGAGREARLRGWAEEIWEVVNTNSRESIRDLRTGRQRFVVEEILEDKGGDESNWCTRFGWYNTFRCPISMRDGRIRHTDKCGNPFLKMRSEWFKQLDKETLRIKKEEEEEARLAKEKEEEEARLAKEKEEEEARLAKEKEEEEARLAKEKEEEEARLAKETEEEARLAKEKEAEEARLAKEKETNVQDTSVVAAAQTGTSIVCYNDDNTKKAYDDTTLHQIMSKWKEAQTNGKKRMLTYDQDGNCVTFRALGWTIITHKRGETKNGRPPSTVCDSYCISPSGKRLRSMKELRHALME